MSIDIGGMRHPYKKPREAFLETALVSREPFGQFRDWFRLAYEAETILEPNAMCLATASSQGMPSARMVLLKSFSPEGFVFFTNYGSRKARELIENPNASLCFFWEPLMRSVRVEGRAEKLPAAESEKYFQSRPRPSQIGACVSDQSEVIGSRTVLEEKQRALEETYGDESVAIPRPEHWGGFLVVPRSVEFWQGQSNRLHDRIIFRRMGEGECLTEGLDGWGYQRLSP